MLLTTDPGLERSWRTSRVSSSSPSTGAGAVSLSKWCFYNLLVEIWMVTVTSLSSHTTVAGTQLKLAWQAHKVPSAQCKRPWLTVTISFFLLSCLVLRDNNAKSGCSKSKCVRMLYTMNSTEGGSVVVACGMAWWTAGNLIDAGKRTFTDVKTTMNVCKHFLPAH